MVLSAGLHSHIIVRRHLCINNRPILFHCRYECSKGPCLYVSADWTENLKIPSIFTIVNKNTRISRMKQDGPNGSRRFYWSSNWIVDEQLHFCSDVHIVCLWTCIVEHLNRTIIYKIRCRRKRGCCFRRQCLRKFSIYWTKIVDWFCLIIHYLFFFSLPRADQIQGTFRRTSCIWHHACVLQETREFW